MTTRIVGSARETRPFSRPLLASIAETKMIGLRSGTEHRFIGVWAVVVRDRVFARSWNDKDTGWRLAFVKEPRGTLQVLDRQVRVRAKAVRSEAVLAAVDRAYRAKYASPANQRWLRGFRLVWRQRTTTEFIPR